MYFEFKPAPKKSAVHSSRTLLYGGKRIWQKRNEPRFCESFPAKLLRKTESALYSHILYFLYLESSVLRTEARKRTIARLVRIRIVLEKSSDFVQETQPNLKPELKSSGFKFIMKDCNWVNIFTYNSLLSLREIKYSTINITISTTKGTNSA